MDYSSSDVIPDAIPFYPPSTDTGPSPSDCLDKIVSKLNVDDYKSIFFLLMDFIGPSNFLYFANQSKSYLKEKFCDKYFEFESKSHIWIEIFGTMQRYDLLQVLGTCEHVYLSDKDTFNQVSPFWKCLYSVCDQLTDSDVRYFKNKMFPDILMNVTCAEELLCQAFVKNIYDENDLQKLNAFFKNRQDCSRLISSYSGATKLSYYRIRRPTTKSPCGIAVILNHEKFCPKPNLQLQERKGSSVDAASLKRMWSSFGFQTTIHTNLEKHQVLELFRNLSRLDHSSYDAFVVCYLSHGDNGIVYTSDGEEVKLDDLLNIMANQCPTLVNKPKLFFVQACSGRQYQQGVGTAPQSLPQISGYEGQTSSSSLNPPLYCDILYFCAAFPGFVSYRTSEGSSWFIKELVQAMDKFGEELTIMNVVTKVTDAVSKKTGVYENSDNIKQMTICWKTLKYELKLKKMLSLERP